MIVEVINSRVYTNPYQRLLYSALESRYRIGLGSVNKAIAQQRATGRTVFHIHWEEALFAKCASIAEAVNVRRDFVMRLKRYVAIGGKVVWTLHNARPHEGRFVQSLFSLRKQLMAVSHRVLVHNQAALAELHAQTGLADLSKVTILPHPSYLDVYEPAKRTRDRVGLLPKNPRTLLHFGMVRAYKGIPELVQKLSSEFMAQHGVTLHIAGQPYRADSFLDDLLAQTKGRSEITYRLESVPSDEVADLFRSYAGIVIPYHNVLTSGVAVLSLTLGVPTVAADTSAMRELFPESSHSLLFNPSSTKDLQRAVIALLDMSLETRRKIAQDYVQRALEVQPKIISRALGNVYDELWQADECDVADVSVDVAMATARSDDAAVSLRKHWWELHHDTARQSRVLSLLQLNSENRSVATRTSETSALALSNQQLALELVKVTLLSNVRAGVSDELILKNIKAANRVTVERSRLDAFYAVRLYRNILSRLEEEPTLGEPPAETSEK